MPAGFHVRLAWRDITRMGQVDTRMAGSDRIGEDGGVKVGVGSMKSLGLIGWGERVVPANIPDWMRQNLAAQPLNPADGRPEVAIPLGDIDPNWLHGAMGHWLRLHRPDLLGPPNQWGPTPQGMPQPGGPHQGPGFQAPYPGAPNQPYPPSPPQRY